MATLEPVLGALAAWIALGQSLTPVQIAGGLLVVGAVIWIQSQRLSLEAEGAPPARHRGAPAAAPAAPSAPAPAAD